MDKLSKGNHIRGYVLKYLLYSLAAHMANIVYKLIYIYYSQYQPNKLLFCSLHKLLLTVKNVIKKVLIYYKWNLL